MLAEMMYQVEVGGDVEMQAVLRSRRHNWGINREGGSRAEVKRAEGSGEVKR